jgi:hypothetical protein
MQKQLLQQIQQMQEEMAAAQESLADETFEVSVGGGAVTVTVNGHQEIQAIKINPDVIDTADEDWVTDLQDLILAAVNQAMAQSKEKYEQTMSGFTGGFESMLPPGLGGLFGG